MAVIKNPRPNASRKNTRGSISFRSLVDLRTVGINTFGSPYLERVNPDGMRRGSFQHVLQLPIALPGILKASEAREHLGIEDIEGSGNLIEFLLEGRLLGLPA